MTGEWIKVKAEKHRCELPQYGRGEPLGEVHAGDQWKCECGKVWKVGSVWSGDQREPLLPGEYPQIRWAVASCRDLGHKDCQDGFDW